MNRWIGFLTAHPLGVLLGVLGLTLLALGGLVDPRTGQGRLAIDPSVAGLLPEGGPERQVYEHARKLFGTDEAIVVGLGGGDVFTREGLSAVLRLTDRLQGIDGVQSVLSLATATTVRSLGPGDLDVAPLLEEVPADPAGLERLRREALANPLFAGSLVSRDGRATALIVSLERMSDRELVARGVDDQVTRAAREESGNLEAWVAGVPHVKATNSRQITRELSYMLPAILGILAVVLLVSLRSIRGMVLPLVTIVLGLIWTLGALAWLGQELNLVTVSVPVLILIVGFTYALHVVTEYYAELRHETDAPSPRPAVRATLRSVAIPVLVTGVTTAAGFVSLALSPIPAVRQFGLYSLLGVAFTLLAALSAAPALLALLPIPRRRPEPGQSGFLDRLADTLGDVSIGNRRTTIAAWVAILGIALVGMTQIRVAVKFPGNMRPDHPIRRDYEAINQHFGGANQIRILLSSDQREAFAEPANLREVRALQDWLEAQPEVGHTSSIADFLMLLNRALHDDDPEFFAVPASRRLASQLLLFGASPATQRMVDARHQTASVLVNTTEGDSDRTTALVRRIQARLDELPGHLRAATTGSPVLLGRVSDNVSRGQLISISAAFLFIYLVLVLMFTSFRVGLLALYPNVLPIAVYFGALGISGVTLNPTTSLVGCLALGIAVDDTIHFFARFNAEARRLADEPQAARSALRALIRPVSFTTVGLCLGFLVLTTSDSGTQVQFGVLSAFTIAVAWTTDVTLSPALCSGVRIVTLWDVLRLDLGPQPQEEIPLMRGLSLRQARIFALMSDIVRLPAGTRLLTEGETGGDMFVALGGELVAWVEHEGKRIELATMRRGSVIGEVGYFAAKRSANVDVVEDALLIRFDSEDLERLRRRYPRTAACVYRNLNNIQAERLVRTTRRLS